MLANQNSKISSLPPDPQIHAVPLSVSLEQRLVLSCCSSAMQNDLARSRELLPRASELNWDAVLSIARRHAVLPLVYRSLKNLQFAPKEVLFQLEQDQKRIIGRNLKLRLELCRILDCCVASGLLIISIKGPLLAFQHFGDALIRESVDLDFFIRRADFEQAHTLIQQLGYSAMRSLSLKQLHIYWKNQAESVYLGKNSGIRLELHWNMLAPYWNSSMPIDYFLGRLVAINFEERETFTFRPEDLLLLLAVHGTKHRWDTLKWLIDIDRLIVGSPDLNWEEVIYNARLFGVARILKVALLISRNLLGSSIQSAIMHELNLDHKAQRISNDITRDLLADIEVKEGLFQDLKFWICVKEKLTDKLRLSFGVIVSFYKKWGELSWEDRLLLLKLFFLLPLIKLSLYFVGIARVQSMMFKLLANTHSPLNEAEQLLKAKKIARIVQYASMITPFGTSCLHRSLALWWLTARRGITSSIKIGLRKELNKFDGHAWVEFNGQVLNDTPQNVHQYNELLVDSRN